MLLAQNLILMGIFFTIPLYLQIVQGLDALETGVRMLPASVGPVRRRAGRLRAGLALRRRGRWSASGLAIMLRLDPDAAGDDRARARQRRRSSPRWACSASAWGWSSPSSATSSSPPSATSDRSEAGGLQNTAQQLGSSLGTALLGAVVITGLIAAFSANVAADPRISERREAAGRGRAGRRRAASSPPTRCGPAPPRRASTPRRWTRWSRATRMPSSRR